MTYSQRGANSNRLSLGFVGNAARLLELFAMSLRLRNYELLASAVVQAAEELLNHSALSDLDFSEDIEIRFVRLEPSAPSSRQSR